MTPDITRARDETNSRIRNPECCKPTATAPVFQATGGSCAPLFRMGNATGGRASFIRRANDAMSPDSSSHRRIAAANGAATSIRAHAATGSAPCIGSPHDGVRRTGPRDSRLTMADTQHSTAPDPPGRRRRLWGILVRKECWRLSWRGWLAVSSLGWCHVRISIRNTQPIYCLRALRSTVSFV